MNKRCQLHIRLDTRLRNRTMEGFGYRGAEQRLPLKNQWIRLLLCLPTLGLSYDYQSRSIMLVTLSILHLHALGLAKNRLALNGPEKPQPMTWISIQICKPSVTLNKWNKDPVQNSETRFEARCVSISTHMGAVLWA